LITSKITRRIDIPHEPDQWIEVRMLSMQQLRGAREEQERRRAVAQIEGFAVLRAMDDQVLAAIAGSRSTPPAPQGPTAVPETPVIALDPLDEYEPSALNRAGIVGWSYVELDAESKPLLVDGNTVPIPVTPENIDALDEVTALFVARELVPKKEPEADRKNGSRRSTAVSTA
jgi:hypothetical protein